MSDLDMELIRGNLIATRAILTAILGHIAETEGTEVLADVRSTARAMVERAVHRMHSDAETRFDADTAKEVSSCADAFLDVAFDAAFGLVE